MTHIEETADKLEILRKHALRRLPDMLDEEKALFSFRSIIDRNRWINEGTSMRYTAIAMLGLLEEKRLGFQCRIDIRPIIERIITEYKYASNLGDLGLALWVLARGARAGVVDSGLDEALEFTITSLKSDRNLETRIIDSMKHSWVLMALLECRACGLEAKGFNAAVEHSYLDLQQNYHKNTSLFSFNRREERGLPPVLKRLSFFAEQVYGILAMASFYESTGDEEALSTAEACADKLVFFQTKKGGWPWRYNAVKGTLAEVFPLYSVHQDGMAPMALARLSQVSSHDYIPHILKGLSWLEGNNELNTRLYDEKLDIIWRSALRKGPLKFFSQMNKALALINFSNLHISDKLVPFYDTKKEVRSYHMGWILCAYAAVQDLKKSSANKVCRTSVNEPDQA